MSATYYFLKLCSPGETAPQPNWKRHGIDGFPMCLDVFGAYITPIRHYVIYEHNLDGFVVVTSSYLDDRELRDIAFDMMSLVREEQNNTDRMYTDDELEHARHLAYTFAEFAKLGYWLEEHLS